MRESRQGGGRRLAAWLLVACAAAATSGGVHAQGVASHPLESGDRAGMVSRVERTSAILDLGRWLSRCTVTILAIGGLAAAATWNDEDPDAMRRMLEASPLEPGLDLGNTYGSGWVVGGGAASVIAAGHLLGDERMTDLGYDLARSFLVGSLVCGAIKLAADRTRPNGGGLSFPSGHTTVAFGTVPVIAHHLGRRAGAGAAVLAVATGLGRMEDRHHFLPDVFFGAALGLAVGDAVVRGRSGGGKDDGVVLTVDRVGYSVRF